MQYFQFIMRFCFISRLVSLHIAEISGSIHWHTVSSTLTAANIGPKNRIKSISPAINYLSSTPQSSSVHQSVHPSGFAIINIAFFFSHPFFPQISNLGDGRRGFHLLHLAIRLLPACYCYATLHIPRGFAVRLRPARLIPPREEQNSGGIQTEHLHTLRGQGGKLDSIFFFFLLLGFCCLGHVNVSWGFDWLAWGAPVLLAGIRFPLQSLARGLPPHLQPAPDSSSASLWETSIKSQEEEEMSMQKLCLSVFLENWASWPRQTWTLGERQKKSKM